MANEAIDAFVHSYETNEEQKAIIDGWLDSKNQLLSNLGNAIKLKTENHSLCFREYYHFDEFDNITGELEILGLSPWNDFHIFEIINSAKLNSCVFYYFNESECGKIADLLPTLANDGVLHFRSAKAFWDGIL